MAEFKDAPKFLIKRLEKTISKKDRKLALKYAPKLSNRIYTKNGKLFKKDDE